MNRVTPPFEVMASILVGLCSCCCTGFASDHQDATAADRQEKTLPKFADARAEIIRYFEQLPDYQPGGILTRAEVEPVFGLLKRLDWQVADAKAIVDRVPPGNSFLVRQLRTRDGRKFMAHVSKYPLGYDRLDRLAKLSRGPELIRQFIRGPEGYKMIQYMTETSGGKNLGAMLAQAPEGKDFNKPTGQIYTLDALLEVLEKCYNEAKQANEAGRPVDKTAPRPASSATAPRAGSN